MFIDNGIYKIGDYGLSRFGIIDQVQKMKMSVVGSPLYAAPEILSGKKYNSNVDVFSTGVMVYESLYGYSNTPWPANTQL